MTQVSAWTVKRERKDLLCLWRAAFKLKRTKRRPPDDLPSVAVPRHNPTAWTPSQVTDVVVACSRLSGLIRGTPIKRSTWFSSLIQFLYWSGARISAALAVRTLDLDLERRIVVLRAATAKTHTEQVLALHDQVIAAVVPLWCPHRDLLWPWPYGRRQLFASYKRILVRAGLPSDRSHMFHALRRTTYTLATRYGSPEIAAQQLGHRIDMSAVYLDRSQVVVRQAADVLPELRIDGNGAAEWII
jgi:integrase